MSVVMPPRTSQPQPDDLEALIKEARARQRRRRLRLAALVAAAAGIAAAAYAVVAGGGTGRPTAPGSAGGAVAGRHCPPGNLGTVAFVRAGALQLLDLHGCRVRTLVRSGVSNPVQISSDGRWVAFGGGYVSTRGGAVHRTPGARTWWPSGTWSPHTDLLALPTTHRGLLLERPGRSARRLLPNGWGAQTVAFSPDGRTLAVSRSLFSAATINKPSAWHQEIWLLDLATGAKRMLFHLHGRALAPALLHGFSPDGRWLLFWEDTQNSASLMADGIPLVALPLAGGKPVTITGELHYRDYLTWCGNSLVYVIDHGGREVTLGDGIAIVSAPNWKPQTILPAGGRTSWTSVACPTPAAAAKGGGGLVVAGGPVSQDEPPGNEHRSLWMVAPKPHATPQQLRVALPPTGASDELPMWSGDGRWLLYVVTRFQDGGHGKLYALDPFGGNVVGPIANVGVTDNYYGNYNWINQIDWHRH